MAVSRAILLPPQRSLPSGDGGGKKGTAPSVIPVLLEHCKEPRGMAEAEGAFPAMRQTTGEIKTASFLEMSYCLCKHSQT